MIISVILWTQFSFCDYQRAYTVRRMVTLEDNPFLESDTALGISRFRSDINGSRHHRHVRHGFHEGLAEVSFILAFVGIYIYILYLLTLKMFRVQLLFLLVNLNLAYSAKELFLDGFFLSIV